MNMAVLPSPGPLAISPEYDLSDFIAAMEALYAERHRRGMLVWQLEYKSGVSFNAGHAWRTGLRFPQMTNFVAVAQTLDFEVVMRSKVTPELVYDLRRMSTAMVALNEARTQRKISTKDLRKVSGVSLSSFYSWLRQSRDPTLGRLNRLAQSLDFEIIMRPKKELAA